MASHRVESIDALRLVAAFMVVAIHCWSYAGRAYFLPITRVAVPLFFLISGYFLFAAEGGITEARIDKSLRKTAKVWLVGTALYWVDLLVEGWLTGSFDACLPGPGKWVLWVVLCNQPIGFHLWFLVALMEGLVAMRLLNRWKLLGGGYERLLLVSACVLITVGCLLNKYLKPYDPILKDGLLYPPVLFFSTPYMVLGYHIAKYRETLSACCRARVWGLVPLLSVLTLTTVWEGQLAPGAGDSYLTTLPLTIGLFLLAVAYPDWGKGGMAEMGRRHSLPIYVLHVLVYALLLKWVGSWDSFLFHPISIFLITLAISKILRPQEKEKG